VRLYFGGKVTMNRLIVKPGQSGAEAPLPNNSFDAPRFDHLQRPAKTKPPVRRSIVDDNPMRHS
jgi:hypothetical protein